MSDEIIDKLTEILQTVMNDDSIEVYEELSATDVENWDSLNHVNLMISVESEFGIRFNSDEISSLANIGELIQLIKEKTS